jgi:hypothetical protein
VERLLLTSSRSYTQAQPIHDFAMDFLNRYGSLLGVHGHCPQGGDAIFHAWLTTHPLPNVGVETHEITPQEWDLHGLSAGPLRNRRMVDLGATECVAFIGPCLSTWCRRPRPHGSHGATGCADMAQAAGIPTTRVWAEGVAFGRPWHSDE